MSDDLLVFAQDTFSSSSSSVNELPSWTLLVVDDDPSIHDVTHLVLGHFRFKNRGLRILDAYSAEEAKTLLAKEQDISVILLDVVMETEHAGLDLVHYIREELKNQFVRIVLRTGQPGQAPELQVISDYDINDYKEKSELTSEKMHSTITAALRSFDDINTIHELAIARSKLEAQVRKQNEELTLTNQRLESEISAKLEAEKELIRSNTQLSSIINNSAAIISLKDDEGRYDLVNRLFKTSFNFTDEQVVGRTDFELFPKHTAELIRFNDNEVKEKGAALQCEEVLPTINGEHFYLSVKFPLFDSDKKLYRICSIATDITERLEIQNQLLHMSQYDALTDLPNRSLFIDRLSRAIEQKADEHIVAALVLNLDRFKLFNDNLGFEAGDQVLKQIAKRLTRTVGVQNSVSRLGSDEFAILVDSLGSEKELVRMAQAVMDSVSRPLIIDGRDMLVTPSIGISRCPDDGFEIHTLLKKANVAMCKAKNSGRNGFRFYLAEDDEKALELLSLEMELKGAVENEEFSVVFQPKISARDGQLSGAEALMRWYHPMLGPVSPNTFIPILEENGTIVEVGEWVFQKACEFAVVSNNQGSELKICINLSSVQFKQDDLVAKLSQILIQTGCSAHWIELELTEGSLVDDVPRAREMLEDLSKIGFSLALDDFGTGYSSLTYLKEFPFNTLKIDRSFVKDSPQNKQDQAIVTTIIHLAHSLGMTVVAEGVETVEQFELLKRLGCNEIQGFLFAKPVAKTDIRGEYEKATTMWGQIK